MSIIPHTFTGTLIDTAGVLTLLVTALLLLSYYRKKETPLDNVRLTKFVSWAIIAATTLAPIIVVYPNGVSMSFLFFILSGAVAGLSAVYLAFGGQSRMLLAYALVVVSVSLVLSEGLRNNFAGIENYTIEPLYSSGSLAAYQTPASQGYYYFLPIGTIISVILQEFSNLNLGLFPVLASVELVMVLFGLWALFERIGLKYAYPALFFIFSPELSFVDGRTDQFPYVAMVFLIVGLASVRSKRADVLLLLPIILVGVFDHPIAPISIIAMIGFLSLVIVLRKARWLQTHRLVFTTLRLALVVTAAYWFLTYIYNLILPHATQTLQSSINLVTSMFFGSSKTVLGGGITSAIAPGYSEPAFRLFVFVWAAPVALAAAFVLVLGIRGLISTVRRSKAVGETLSGFTSNLAVASCLAAIVTIGIAYAAYATGTLQGQYLIPAGYFLAVVAAGFVLNQLIGSRKILVLGVATVLIFSVALIGTYGPDWATLEHSNFQVQSTIHSYTSYSQSKTLTSLIGNHSFSGIYSDYDMSVGPGGEYKPVRSVISSVDQGASAFNSYGNSLFVLVNSRLLDPSVSNQTQDTDVVYFSNSHFAVFSG